MIPYNVYDIEISDNLNQEEIQILIIDYLYSILADSNILENIEYITDLPEWLSSYIDNYKNFEGYSDYYIELIKGFTFEYKSFQYCIYAYKNIQFSTNHIEFALKNFEESHSYLTYCPPPYTNINVHYGIAISNDYFIFINSLTSPSYYASYLTIKVDEPINLNDTDLYVFKYRYTDDIIYNKPFNNESYLDSKTTFIKEIDTDNLNNTINFYNNKYPIYKIYTTSADFGIRGRISKMLDIKPLYLTRNNIYKINDDKYLYVDTFLLKIDTELEANNLEFDTFFLSSSSSSPPPPPPTNKKDFQNGLIVGMTIGKDF